MKKKVCFGQNVIFKHIDSGSYISGTIRPSTGSNGAFTVQVSEKLSESLVFKLMPYRSFEFNDMAIPFDSPILIRNEFNYGYMTFEKIGMGDQGKSRGTYIEKKPIESNDSYRIPVKTQSLKSDVYEVVTHFVDLSCEREVPMPWRFKLHVNNVVNDTLIQHDVVYLKHTEKYLLFDSAAECSPPRARTSSSSSSRKKLLINCASMSAFGKSSATKLPETTPTSFATSCQGWSWANRRARTAPAAQL
jgi:hypothetical protein